MYGMSAREAWRFWWRCLAGPVAVIVLVLCAGQVGPAWSAHRGHGRAGTWTVTGVVCGRATCEDVGRFVSADGSRVLTGAGVFGGSSLEAGASTAAVDAGGDVLYPPGGGRAWLVYGGGAALLAVLCGAWVWTVPVAAARRRRAVRAARVGSGP
ncbi:hypothetical protein ACFRAR_34640 [Kitasatospora sp. NPDC056651]|uniref:hypothetical protein n=1 Tax=Kitasatospora sp. NPDC056651 TaxID=3345892 RepID=UPI0036B41562